METSPIIRFRIDKEIARRAPGMAEAIGTELPEVLRTMRTKAARTGSFSIDVAHDLDRGETVREQGSQTSFELHRWDPYKIGVQAELALGQLLHSLADAATKSQEAEHVQNHGPRWALAFGQPCTGLGHRRAA